MKPLLAYLVVRFDADSWEVSSFRDLDSLLSGWRNVGHPRAAAVVHVGFWRPNKEVFETALAGRPGIVLLTEAARASLPPEFRTAPYPCATAAGLGLFEALSGWGYEREEPTASPARSMDIAEAHCGASNGALPEPECRWLALAHNQEPALWKMAAAVGITDDMEYLARERLLDFPMRDALAAFRFKCLTDLQPSEDALFRNLVCSPPWLLALDVNALDLSTRPTNRLAEEKLGSVADIARFGEARLMKIPNMGRKSVEQIAHSIFKAYSRGCAFCAAHPASGDRGIGGPIDVDEQPKDLFASPAIESPVESSNESTSELPLPQTFPAALNETLDILDEKDRRIVALRMGLHGSAQTLESVGELFGVTRERIRQIEARSLKKIKAVHSPWFAQLEAKLDALLSGREDPLPLVGLEVLDSWFRGADDLAESLEYALAHLGEQQKYWLIKIDGQIYVTGIDRDAWIDSVKQAKSLLASHIRERKALPETEARWLVESVLVGAGEELRPLLWQTATRWANFSVCSDGQRLLASLGIGAESVVEAVLLESDRPLHYEEIAKRCAERGKPVEVRRAHNAAAKVGILMARGVYGLERHIPLTNEEAAMVLAEAENMLSENAAKQWHAHEICEGLEERGLDLDGRLSNHVVNFVLGSSKHLVYLGRMVWAARAMGAKGTADRIDVWQAMASLLEKNGGPMRTEEIRNRLSRDRGLGETFQLHERDPVVRVGEGRWGLLWRDIPFSENDAKRIVAEIEDIMHTTGRGLHVSEMARVLVQTADIAARVKDPVLLASLAQRTGRMKASKGGYIYPSDWEGPRRLCATEAVALALADVGKGGASVSEMSERVSALVGREIISSVTSRLLIAAGAIYDGESGRWALPENDEADPSDESFRDCMGDDSPDAASLQSARAP